MPALITLADLRDSFIIAYGVLGMIFFLIGIAGTLVLVFSVKGLVKAARNGNQDAFASLVRKHRQPAYLLALKFIRP